MRPAAADRRPTVEALEDPLRFELVRRVRHDALASFVREVLRERGGALHGLHRGLTVAFALLAVGVGVREGAGPARWALSLGAGALGTLVVLMPLHEGLHAVTYLALGARDIRWRLTLRPLSAYVLAHRFVVGRAGFRAVVLAPTLLIDVLLAGAAWGWPAGRLALLAGLLGHHVGSAGDLALLCFSTVRPCSPLFSYDDADAASTAFFSTRSSTGPPTGSSHPGPGSGAAPWARC